MRFIVELEDSTNRSVIENCGRCGNPTSLHKFVILDSNLSRERVADIDGVKCAESDIELTLMSRTTNWALSTYDLVEHTSLPLGRGVNIYIHDTGISNHEDFSGRLSRLKTSTLSNSHGTAVASMAGGRYYGIAPKSNIIDVGTNLMLSDIIKGYDKVLNHHRESNSPSILNLSYGGYGLPSIVEDVINELVNNGIIIVAAAGNDSVSYPAQPAAYDSVVAVGSVNRAGRLSRFSNYGNGVDIYAPGEDVMVADSGSQSGASAVNGTSFSSPLVAGSCAIMLEGSDKFTTRGEAIKFKEELIKKYGRSFQLSSSKISPEVMNSYSANLLSVNEYSHENFKDVSVPITDKDDRKTLKSSVIAPIIIILFIIIVVITIILVV